MTIADIVAELGTIADRLERTQSLRRRDPELWLVERDELARELRRLTGRLAAEHTGRRLSGRATIAAADRRYDPGHDILVEGRRVRVEKRRLGA